MPPPEEAPGGGAGAALAGTAAFLAWVSWKYDKRLVRKLDKALREGAYSDAIWLDVTGKSALGANEIAAHLGHGVRALAKRGCSSSTTVLMTSPTSTLPTHWPTFTRPSTCRS